MLFIFLPTLALSATMQDPPGGPSFDCAMRQAAYEYGKKLLPRKGGFSSLYYALNLNDPACPTPPPAKPMTFPSVVRRPPLGALFVSAEHGDDAAAGTIDKPLRSIQVAADRAVLRQPPQPVVLRGGTHHVREQVLITAKHSGLRIASYPGEQAVVSGGVELNVAWTPFNVSKRSWIVQEGQNAVYGATIDNKTFVSYGQLADAQACQDACAADTARGCSVWTWHDQNQGAYAKDCYGRLDGVYAPTAQSGHTSGRAVGPMNIYVADVKGQVDEIPGLQIDGVRATRARYPNLPGGIEVSPGYGAMIPSANADWTPPDFGKYGNVTFFTDNVASHARNDTSNGWFQHYMIGVGGLCSVYDPPVSYWCSEHPSGGGAFAFRTPSGVTPKAGVLPNAPYKDVSEAILNVWRPARWANWMFRVKDYDPKTNNFTFGEGGFQGARGNNAGGDFFVENVLEELDNPGEFYFDKKASKLYLFYNGTGAPPASATVVAPQLKVLVNVSGTQWDPVRDFQLDSLAFRASAYTYMEPHGVPSAGDWALERFAAVYLQGTATAKIHNCSFARLDGNAIMLSGFNRNATISDSDFEYIGGNAIASWGYTNETASDPGRPGVALLNYPHAGVDGTDGEHPRYTLVSGNLAREVGLYEKQSSFYVQAKTAQAFITGNVFFNGPRAGINANDGFGGGDVISHNLVFSTCRESGDHGPFNSWDRQPFLTTVHDGTPSMRMAWREIHHNFFIDNYSPQENVDNDDGSAYYHTHDNFFVYGGNGMKNDFGGHDNHHLNNVYAYVGQALAYYDAPMLKAHEDHFESNKVVLTGGKVGSFTCTGVGATIMSKNSYYTSDGDVTECGMPLAQWQAKGNDAGSTVAKLPDDATIIGWAKALLGF
jgi:hypothetical protein